MSVDASLPFYCTVIGAVLLTIGVLIVLFRRKSEGRRRKYGITFIGIGVALLLLGSLIFLNLPSDFAPLPEFTAYQNIERKYDPSSNSSWISNTTWTVVSQPPVNPIKSNVTVTVQNASGYAFIDNKSLLLASGTYGFNYTQTSNGDYISRDDKFILDWAMYKSGSNLTLMDGNLRILNATIQTIS